jgi:25S rRNA (adenine(2142)-N(1))-methyltransferase, Bmt2
MPIDLNSRHPRIIQQDFFTMNLQEHQSSWNAISLSLVVNFVPKPSDRGTAGNRRSISNHLLKLIRSHAPARL